MSNLRWLNVSANFNSPRLHHSEKGKSPNRAGLATQFKFDFGPYLQRFLSVLSACWLPQCVTHTAREVGLTGVQYLTMWGWLEQNREWVFSRVGIASLGAIWWFVNKFWPKSGKAQMSAPAITTQAPSTSIAPVITMNPTINFPIEPRPAELPKLVVPPSAVAPGARPNLCIEATKNGKIFLEGDTWTLTPISRGLTKPNRALLADISNVPTDLAHTAKAAVRAGIRMDYGGRQRTFSPLPWLEEYNNMVFLETGARKTVVLAVGEDSRTGAWNFVLNHRSDYNTRGASSAMDWTNPCPIPSDLPFEILMIDMNSGALLTKFVYLWTFDANLNWPILKLVE